MLTVNQLLSLARDSETPFEFARSTTFWSLEALETLPKVKLIFGVLKLKRKLERLKPLVPLKSSGHAAEGMFWPVCCTKDLKLTTTSWCLEQTEPKPWWKQKSSLNFTPPNGNLTSPKYFRSQIWIKSKRKNTNRKRQNQRKFSSTARAEKTPLFNRWWDSRWQSTNRRTKDPRK